MSVIYTPDRRTNPRAACSGDVEITFEDPVPTTIHAELVENSPVGFRATHICKDLVAGLNVRFKREGGSGRARVIWTHVLDGECVTGFLVL